ncbi:hypothetical protein QEN19_002294 [Hanseniaspora menglaensis]
MVTTYYRLVLLFIGAFLPFVSSFTKVKNHVKNDYYVLEISKEHFESFLTEQKQNKICFENSLYGFEDTHQVISVAKDSYSKRSLPFDNKNIKKLHKLDPGKRLFKRAPQPIETLEPPKLEEVNIWEGFSEEQIAQLKNVMEEYQINDPLFKKQWHLVNSFFPGNDLNILPVWDMNITGNGVTVAIVDDGLDFDNPDLKDNFNAQGSYDFNDKTDLPKPRLADDYHGTRCAGEIAAAKNNDYCGLGVAFNAKVSGLRILSGEVTPEEEAAAMMYEMNINDIYSCSWGPTDNGKEMEKPSELVTNAMQKGVSEGRDSKGNIYVFASGNGANLGDNCNYDGYTNSIYSITVGAIDWKGLHSTYSESCSALLTVTYSSGSNEYIHSTDINNVCSDKHGGTSAAAPMAAGVYALVLEANKDLTWRDVQYLTIESSVVINEHDGDWQQPSNYFNKKYSHMYGFGKIDTFEIVSRSLDWKNVNEQVSHLFDRIDVNEKSSSDTDIIESKIIITEEQFKEFKHLEHITVTIDADSTFRGLTEIDLVAPDGSVSHLALPRKMDRRKTGFPNWKFMTVVHWGTNGVGEWKLVSRVTGKESELTLKGWQLEIFGEKRDAADYLEPTVTTESPVEQEPTGTVTATETHTENQPTSTASSTTLPAPTEDNHKALKESKKLLKAHHYLGFLLFLLIIALIYYALFINRKKKFQRLRAEAYEFDIIDNDSDYNASIANVSMHDGNDTVGLDLVVGHDDNEGEAMLDFDITDVEVEEAFDFNEDAEILAFDDIPEEEMENDAERNHQIQETATSTNKEDSFKNPFENSHG